MRTLFKVYSKGSHFPSLKIPKDGGDRRGKLEETETAMFYAGSP